MRGTPRSFGSEATAGRSRSIELSVTKPKLPKGLSYVLKTSLLEAALEEADLDIEVALSYWTPQIRGSILKARFLLPNDHVDRRRAYFDAGSLPSHERAAAFAQLKEIALPQIVAWLVYLTGLPDNSPVLNGEMFFEASFQDGELTIVQEPKIDPRSEYAR